MLSNTFSSLAVTETPGPGHFRQRRGGTKSVLSVSGTYLLFPLCNIHSGGKQLVPQIDPSVPQPVFAITEKAPTRAFS